MGWVSSPNCSSCEGDPNIDLSLETIAKGDVERRLKIIITTMLMRVAAKRFEEKSVQEKVGEPSFGPWRLGVRTLQDSCYTGHKQNLE